MKLFMMLLIKVQCNTILVVLWIVFYTFNFRIPPSCELIQDEVMQTQIFQFL